MCLPPSLLWSQCVLLTEDLAGILQPPDVHRLVHRSCSNEWWIWREGARRHIPAGGDTSLNCVQSWLFRHVDNGKCPILWICLCSTILNPSPDLTWPRVHLQQGKMSFQKYCFDSNWESQHSWTNRCHWMIRSSLQALQGWKVGSMDHYHT